MTTGCAHLPEDLTPPLPVTPDGCTTCVASGRHDWVHLRECQACGHVGCCDSSPGRHATAHSRSQGHPLVRSMEPGEDWFWCYLDQIAFEIDAAPAAYTRTA